MSFRAIKVCLGLLLAAIVFFTFIPVVGNDFVNWDDHAFIGNNHAIHSLSQQSLRWMLTTFYQGAWHPLTWFSHALDRHLWGLDAGRHHLMNVLCHCANAVLFFAACLSLMEKADLSAESKCIAAFVAALFFGVHPLRVESVAWASQRKDVLSTLFCLSTFLAYLAYARADCARPRRNRYCLSLLFYFLALLSKPTVMSLPLALLAIDYYPLERLGMASLRKCLWDKIPFIVFSAGTTALTMMAAGGAVVAFSYVPVGDRIMNAAFSAVSYLRMTLLPVNLVPVYQLDRSLDYFGPKFVVSALLVVLTTLLCVWRGFKNDRIWVAAWFWYLITLGPMLGLLMSYRHAMADRYTYLTTAPFLVLGGLGAAWTWERAGKLKSAAATRGVIVGVLLLLAVLCSAKTRKQIEVWKDTETLWTYVIDHADHVPALAFFGLGTVMEEKNELDKALECYQTALSLHPVNNNYRVRVAGILVKKGKKDEALGIYEDLTKEEPRNPVFHAEKANALAQLGRIDDAVKSLEKALDIAPTYGPAMIMLSIVHYNRKDLPNARRYYLKYVSAGYPPRPKMEEELGIKANAAAIAK